MGGVGLRCWGPKKLMRWMRWFGLPLASHGSAAYLWGLYRFAPETIDVTAPIRRRATRGVSGALLFDPCGRGSAESGKGYRSRQSLGCCSISSIRAKPEQIERLLERGRRIESFLDLPCG